MSDPAPQRGEVWWVDLDPTRGAEIKKRRPAIVLTASELCRVRRTVVVVPLTSKTPARPPLTVSVLSGGTSSVAVCDQIRAVDKSRLIERQGVLAAKDLRAVEACIRAVLVV